MKTILSLAGAIPLALISPSPAQDAPSGPGTDLVDLYERMHREGVDEARLLQLLDEELRKDLIDSMPEPGAPAEPDQNIERRIEIPRETGEMERRIWRELHDDLNLRDQPEDARRPGPGEMSPWLIGLAVEPIDPFVRTHLDIPEDTGVRVSMVAPQGPAARAGLKQNDIILSANGRKLRSLPELREVVMQAGREGKAIDLELLHEGQRKTVSVEPRGPERPQEEKPEAGKDPAAANRPMMEIQRKLDEQQREIEKLRQEVEKLREKINRE